MIKLLLFLIGLIFPSKENTHNRNQASITIQNSLEPEGGNGNGNGHGNGGSTSGNTGQTPPPFTQL
ncbi:hypothetical protein [Chryseobacterium oncorhynchi]|uniref:Uncharacterized protein n=1 Tax=Chryseobacterium oncorhynchi TaxID=741074 RepID=A0A316WVI8_9FLAO|nr:hypothetical protein [Chryseobacterium oncorhynchi]PWN64303.1 hypothetical protein C1638_010355 [Chryseobacterium oncorhynchi]